jgi:hypothetical protein
VLLVVAAGMAAQRDALLVTEAAGRPLRTLGPHEVDDELLDGIWRNAGRLHELRVAHRRLDGSRIVGPARRDTRDRRWKACAEASRYAIQFIALAVPSSAARLALDVRFFGRNGIEGGAAFSIGVIASVCGFITQVLLILTISLSGLASLDLGGSGATTTPSTSGSSSSGGHRLLILTAVLVVAGVTVTVAVPKYRTAVRLAVPRYRAMLRAQASSATTALRVLRSPPKVVMIFAATWEPNCSRPSSSGSASGPSGTMPPWPSCSW